MLDLIERVAMALERLPIRDISNPGSDLDGLRLREAARAAVDVVMEPTPAIIDTMAHYLAETMRGNPAMGGPMSCTITDAHRRYANAALRGMEAVINGWPQSKT